MAEVPWKTEDQCLTQRTKPLSDDLALLLVVV